MRSVKDSYQRFGMDRIDLHLFHDINTWLHPATDCLRAYPVQLLMIGVHALSELKSSCVVSAVGAGVNEYSRFHGSSRTWILIFSWPLFGVLCLNGKHWMSIGRFVPTAGSTS